jgi:hypothetical protein
MGDQNKARMYLALCVARADGSNKYPIGEKHALLVMVLADAAEDAENKIPPRLEARGWVKAAIDQLKLLGEPFQSDDPIFHDCYDDALHGDVGIVVYRDPVPDTQ